MNHEAWLGRYFFLAEHAPWVLRLIRPIMVAGAARDRRVFEAARANARGLFGPERTPRRDRAHARAVVGTFYDAVLELVCARDLDAEAFRARVDGVDGMEHYRAARAARRGAIVATAHLGSFELGLAALTGIEPSVHVVFKRDAFAEFETIRSAVRARLGVHEAPIDSGLDTWLTLREALQRDEVVVMQSDRAMPGQQAAPVDVCHGRLRIPLGPAKLALSVGAPIIPIFLIASSRGRCRVLIEPSIDAESCGDSAEEMARRFGAALERVLRRWPTQWLVLGAAFEHQAQALR